MNVLPGYSTNRVAREPDERIFAREWVKLNKGSRSTLEYLRGGGTNAPKDISEDENRIVSTVVQWLGSPCGSEWLRDTLKKIDRTHAR